MAVNGRTGKQFDNSFTSKSPLTLTLDEHSALPGFLKGLTGQKVGSRVLVAIPPKDGFGQARTELGIKADDTMVFLFDIVAKVPAEGRRQGQEASGRPSRRSSRRTATRTASSPPSRRRTRSPRPARTS